MLDRNKDVRGQVVGQFKFLIYCVTNQKFKLPHHRRGKYDSAVMTVVIYFAACGVRTRSGN